MNEKLTYASMLEIPESTCNITYKPIKKSRAKSKKKANSEQLKQQLVEKVNSEVNTPELPEEQTTTEVERQIEALTGNVKPKKKKSKRSIIITAQLFAVGALAVTILLTSILNENSGLNNLFKGVFNSQPTQEVIAVDNRTYQDFKPVFTATENSAYSLVNGVATMSGKGSVYSVLDGTVTRVTKNDETGLFAVEVAHSDNFSTIVEGLDMTYVAEGSQVFAKIPLGYAKNSGSTTCFMADGAILSDFQIVDNAVIWAV